MHRWVVTVRRALMPYDLTLAEVLSDSRLLVAPWAAYAPVATGHLKLHVCRFLGLPTSSAT